MVPTLSRALMITSLLPAALLAAPAGAAVPGTTPGTAAPVRATALAGASPGYDSIGVRRGGTWLLRGSVDARTATVPFVDGPAGAAPLAGDFDGDGNDSLALFASGVWRLSDGAGGQTATIRFGGGSFTPVIGDWDGDGREDLGVVRAGVWYLRTGLGTRVVSYGRAGDVPVVGDWDGDGTSGIGIRRGTALLLRQVPFGGRPDVTFTYGVTSDRLVVGDWDHDGADQVGVFRSGTWILRASDGRVQSFAYGSRGDVPVVLTRASLTPGLEHRVISTGTARAQVTSVDLAQVAPPRPVLARDTLVGVERTTAMTRRSSALVGINGDFAAPDGRPIHPFATAATLQQYGDVGSALGFSGGGLAVADRPTVAVTLTPQGAPARAVERFNRGAPTGDELAAYTGVASTAERLPDNGCYAILTLVDGPRGGVGGAVRRGLSVLGSVCGGLAPAIEAGAVTLASGAVGTGADFLRALQPGQPVAMDQLLGFPGSTALLGASERLVVGGQVQSNPVDFPGAFTQSRLPRTAAGLTADGRLLLVVVDGRQPGWSEGMSLRELATLLQGLGAVSAVNLDGGGSSTMVLSGVIVNRPSDGAERSVSSALTVAARAALPPAPPSAPAANAGTAALRADTWSRVARDPGSTGGLLASRQLNGQPPG